MECGCDEVGRGSAVAEIYVCACILNPNYEIDGLRDSKKLSARKRELLAEEIKRHAISWCIATASLEEIELLNVHQATLLAMKRAVEGLRIRPDKVFVDGNHVPKISLPVEAIVKGDDLIPAISAASILAKVARDQALLDYHRIYPNYGFDSHKGYLTKAHIEALQKHGPCPIHRKTYAPIRKLLEKPQYVQGKMF
ncbi:Ribonuclease HII [Sporomusa carbonis]|uniref:ribonuclease HII n=1 Tax=Sporomusa carbonis TaxID=3076075 RepID=UPI003A7901DC